MSGIELKDLPNGIVKSNAPLASGEVIDINFGGLPAEDVGDPIANTDAATKGSSDAAIALATTNMVEASGALTSSKMVIGNGSKDIGVDNDVESQPEAVNINKNLTVYNGLSVGRILFREDWSAGNNTLNGDLGTWVENPIADDNSSVPLPPDGGNCQRRDDAGSTWTLTSPQLDLKFYHLLEEGDDVANNETFTRTRVFIKGWITTQSFDASTLEQIYVDVFDGSNWNEVYSHRANNSGPASGALWVKFVCDISSFISATVDTQIRFRVEGNTGVPDRWGMGRFFIYESDTPTQMGNCFFGRNGTGFGNKAPQAPLHTTGRIIFDSLPTSDPLVSGELWNNSGVLTVSAG